MANDSERVGHTPGPAEETNPSDVYLMTGQQIVARLRERLEEERQRSVALRSALEEIANRSIIAPSADAEAMRQTARAAVATDSASRRVPVEGPSRW